VSVPSYEDLVEVISELRREVAELKRENAELRRLVEELRRGGKRQAAPFSKGEPKADPKRPGRKPGGQYGRQAVRAAPKRVDEWVSVPCPLWSSCCEAPVRLKEKATQYQIDLPPIRPRTTGFEIQIGECVGCGRRVQARDPRQTSTAVEVGAVHLGPGVISLTAYLNKVGGMSYEKIASMLKEMCGLEVARSTLCRALARLARRAEPTYEGLVQSVRASPVVYPDETGWRIGGLPAWLWAYATFTVTVYAIEHGRGYAEAEKTLGADYAGVIGADGWAPYRRFSHALLQTCLAHLLRRCKEMLETATRGGVRFPRKVKGILKDALELRDRRDAGTISTHGLCIAKGRLEARMRSALSSRITNVENRRFAKHLARYQDALFVFLERDDLEATNWPAEQAIRPAVVNRKSCGGNRTEAGARTQAVLMSLLRTCRQQGHSAITLFTKILRDPRPRPQRLLLSAQC